MTDPASAEATTAAEEISAAPLPIPAGPRVVIGVGGTAGHVVPAIAVADVLRARGGRTRRGVRLRGAGVCDAPDRRAGARCGARRRRLRGRAGGAGGRAAAG